MKPRLVLVALLPALSCARDPWTADAALAPHRARLDADHDGRVTLPEYERTLWNGPPFASVDLDGDGDLSAPELVALVRAESPTTFDGAVVDTSVKRAGAGVSLPAAGERDVRELLVWMDDALRSTGRPGLDPAVLAVAARSARLDSPETLAALATLRPQWLQAGWTWPNGVP